MIEGYFCINGLSFNYFNMQDRMYVVKEEFGYRSFSDLRDGFSKNPVYCGQHFWPKTFDNLPYSILLKIHDFLKICFGIQNRIKLFRQAGSGV